jgi:YVTN family beta-propeller protein
VGDTSSDEKVGEGSTGAGAHMIAFSGDGAFAYVSNQLEDTVSLIDVADAGVLGTSTVGAKPNGLAATLEHQHQLDAHIGVAAVVPSDDGA